MMPEEIVVGTIFIPRGNYPKSPGEVATDVVSGRLNRVAIYRDARNQLDFDETGSPVYEVILRRVEPAEYERH